jgi:hypothetical protein
MALVTVVPAFADSKIDKFDSKDFPIPSIGEHYVMSKTKYTSICSYEIRIFCLVTYVSYDRETDQIDIEVVEIL